MDNQRPDPDELLARVQTEEARKHRGKLKIFFGASAGVGKTYAMLESAQTLRQEGMDVVAGYVEPHDRPETTALMEGLEVIPRRSIEYRGATLREFDLDAALARHPTLILVDELAHTNAEGSRHRKRWQDVEELLDAGINVYTTVNVQHIESLNDVVAQITGTIVRETIPDSILEEADEVELIDLSPDDLLKRLREGKVYLSQQAEQALQNFFRKGNLMALREMALRRTAERVDDQMQVYRQDKSVEQIWPAGERIMVCISPSPLASRLVRAAKRMATGLHAEWLTVYVETPGAASLSEADRNRVIQTLRLAEQLGAETTTLTGHNVTEEMLNFAHKRNVTKIIVGKPVHSIWRDFLLGSVLNELIRKSGSIDVYVISGEADAPQQAATQTLLNRRINWMLHLKAVVVVAICSILASAMFSVFASANIVMVYLVGIVVVASRYGRGPSVLASLLSVLAFDFLFVPPHLTFAVSDTQYLITFGVMLLVGLTISRMTVRIKEQAEIARERERRTASLYSMSREFANNSSAKALAEVAIEHIREVFDSEVLLFLPGPNGELQTYGSDAAKRKLTEQENGVLRWVYDHGQEAGVGTQTLPGSNGFYLPLQTPQGKIGVVGIYSSSSHQIFSPDQIHLLEIYGNQTALAIERARLSEESEHAQVQIETERLRNSLLSSVSHDLRTPLAAITGAVSGLLENDKKLDPHSQELMQIAYEEAERLNRLVGNLLEMTRLESGSVVVDKEWQPLEEVIGTTTLRLDNILKDHPLKTRIPHDLPLVPIDSILIEQVLVNLLENAVKYAPAGSPIDLSAWAEAGDVIVEVADRGPGLPPGDETRIFEKFFRGRPTITSGVGLGLAICQAIVQAHGGRIWASNRSGGGASFRFTLPLDGEPPQVTLDDD
jgi:two-component system, OmpR family, sensor histidine kinase KdpD